MHYVAFDNPPTSEVDYVSVTVYDASDAVVYTYLSASPENVQIDLPSANGAYMVLDDAYSSAYIIDNLTF